MNDQPQINGLGDEVPQSAVSIYGQDSGMDDFPVLKAFQQYIDAEQAKARKRIMSLGVFFLVLTGAVIAVFVILLIGMSDRNQQLNDRILEYVMRDRDRPAATVPPVVVHQPTQDSSALVALTAKLEAMERKLNENRMSEEKAAAERAAAEKAVAEKDKELEKMRREAEEKEARAKAESERAVAEESRRTAKLKEEIETLRLKALLEAEREKAAKEKARRREAELEAYRRKHYPEFYRKKTVQEKPGRSDEDPIDDSRAISYFSDDDEEEEAPSAKRAPVEMEKPAPQPAKEAPAPGNAGNPRPADGSSSGLGKWSLPEN